jgi:AraC-like DNA-binding protein
VDYFDRLGSRTGAYLEKFHLSPDQFDDPDALVPLRPFHEFVYSLGRAEGIDHLGLRIARSVSLAGLGKVGERLLRVRNVFRYLDLGCRIAPTITTNQRFWLQFEGPRARFCHAEVDNARPTDMYLFVLELTIETLRSVVGERWVPSEVTLPSAPAPGLAAISEGFTNVRAEPARPYASFTFPRHFLARPMRRPGRADVARRPLGFASPTPRDFGESALRLAESLVLDGFADLPTAADASGLTRRTFQRRLAECGTDFSHLVRDARISLSERWLRETERPITDIAHRLGYADSANFTRAFRRVNGLSPSAYRLGLVAGGPGVGPLAH